MNSIVVLVGLAITLVTGAPVLAQLLREHPRGLFVLFFAEMWERFSYYGMRGLLVFYLTQQFLFDDKAAAAHYGAYTTLVYLVPLIGGMVADRWLGARKAVAIGALLLVAGHFTMAIEGPPARQWLDWRGHRFAFAAEGRGDAHSAKLVVQGRPYAFSTDKQGAFHIAGLPTAAPLPEVIPQGQFSLPVEGRSGIFTDVLYLALALIITGVGFLKANISALVGKLYDVGDPRRDPGFTLYYYGINLGAFWAAILCGYLGQAYGWKWGFGVAGAGMLAGWVSFVAGRKLLEGKGEPPDPALLRRRVAGPLSLETVIYLAIAPTLAVVWLLVQRNAVVGAALTVGSVASLLYLGLHMARRLTRIERQRLYLAFVLIGGSVVFFTLFAQGGTSLSLFAERNTDLVLTPSPIIFDFLGQAVVLGTRAQLAAAPAGAWWIDTSFAAAQAQSFNAGFILILAPFFAELWRSLGLVGREPPPTIKFGLGLIQVGLGFLIIVWLRHLADAQLRLPLLVLALTYLLHTTGELCLSPVGLSEITKLAPAALVSTLMAIWFLASSWAEYIGAAIARLAGTATAGGQVLDPAAALASALRVFSAIGWAGIASGAVFLAISPLIKGWAHGADDTHAPDAAGLGGTRRLQPKVLRTRR
ncbi:MAG TPA: oligopeptide:H+ symporter [Caulobacteraceae bacterium]|nr:oligopeptide:H+ symporter [Caulobacteraceae bacterium]